MGQPKQLDLRPDAPRIPPVDFAAACRFGASALGRQLQDLAIDAHRFEHRMAADPMARAAYVRYMQLRAAVDLLEAHAAELRRQRQAETVKRARRPARKPK